MMTDHYIDDEISHCNCERSTYSSRASGAISADVARFWKSDFFFRIPQVERLLSDATMRLPYIPPTLPRYLDAGSIRIPTGPNASPRENSTPTPVARVSGSRIPHPP